MILECQICRLPIVLQRIKDSECYWQYIDTGLCNCSQPMSRIKLAFTFANWRGIQGVVE